MRFLIAAALVIAVPAFADSAKKPAASKSVGSYSASDLKTVTAIVKSIDLATRHVTVTLPDGKEQTFAVGKEARNLAQVKVGDQVVVQYYQSIDIDVTPPVPGQPLPQPTEAVATDRSAKGKAPEGVVTRTVMLTGTVEKLDLQNKVAVIKGSGGNTVEVKIQHPDRWTKVKVGDIVTARYSEALAIAVQPPPPTVPSAAPAPAPAPVAAPPSK
jgi:hypothetical protein